MLKEQLPLVVGVVLVIALLYAAREFAIIHSPVFGLIALFGAIAVALVAAARLRPASAKGPGDK